MGEGPHHEVKLQFEWDALPPYDMAIQGCLARQPTGVWADDCKKEHKAMCLIRRKARIG